MHFIVNLKALFVHPPTIDNISLIKQMLDLFTLTIDTISPMKKSHFHFGCQKKVLFIYCIIVGLFFLLVWWRVAFMKTTEIPKFIQRECCPYRLGISTSAPSSIHERWLYEASCTKTFAEIVSERYDYINFLVNISSYLCKLCYNRSLFLVRVVHQPWYFFFQRLDFILWKYFI